MIRAIHEHSNSRVEIISTEEVDNHAGNTPSKVDLLEVEINLKYPKQKVKIESLFLI